MHLLVRIMLNARDPYVVDESLVANLGSEPVDQRAKRTAVTGLLQEHDGQREVNRASE